MWRILAYSILSLATLYFVGAIIIDGPAKAGSAINIFLAIVWFSLIAYLIRSKLDRIRKYTFILVTLAVVIIFRSTITASNDRDWEAEFSRLATIEIDGDKLTFHQFRNFIHTRDSSVEQWETRVYHLSKLRSMDLFFDAFGGEILAHTILSFDFGEEGRLCLSIEARREKGEKFTPVGGLYKMFEIQYIFGSEEDLVAVRTEIRDEPVFLYRFRSSPKRCRFYLQELIEAANDIHQTPSFYNVIFANCTTSLRAQIPEDERRDFDWRIILNGYLDSYLFEKNAFVTDGLTFEEYNEQAHINDAAGKVTQRSNYSSAIRENRVGF